MGAINEIILGAARRQHEARGGGAEGTLTFKDLDVETLHALVDLFPNPEVTGEFVRRLLPNILAADFETQAAVAVGAMVGSIMERLSGGADETIIINF